MIRLIFPVLAGMALVSGTAMAAPGEARDGMAYHMQVATAASMAEKCTALERQADTAIKEHASAKKLGDAQMLRNAGNKMCAGNNKAEGIKKFQAALRDLGVKPQY